ncbi:MAG: hypothetical protein ACKOA6_12965, partial [Actinomycetota bacterium]
MATAALLILAGCGSEGDASDSDESPAPTSATAEEATTSTVALAELSSAYTFAGPYPVGVTSLTLEGGNAV